METATDYVNAVLQAHPTVSKLHVPGAQLDGLELHQLPDDVGVYAWAMDYCQGNDEDGAVVVVFRF